MKNRIRWILEEQEIPILRLSEMLNQHYAQTHKLVDRDKLNTVSLETLSNIAKALKVDIKDLYEEEENEEI